MKVIFFFICFLTINNNYAQVFDIHKKVLGSKDSSINLTYLKNVDNPLRKALDTFITLKNNKLGRHFKDSGFIEIVLHNTSKKGFLGYFVFQTTYGNYLSFVDEKYKSDLICFTFYKSYLVLITAPNDSAFKLSINNECRSLLKSILYQEMSAATKREIDCNSEVILITNKALSKRFYFGFK